MDASQLLAGAAVVPVVVIEDADTAVELARTLARAGLGVIEVTLRTESALESIRRIAEQVPEVIVGAGSVRRVSQFADVHSAGAKFAVSPGASDALLAAATALNLPFVPGAVTPSESIRLLEQGFKLQKFFPAELAGGMAMLKAMGAPIPEARFFPTGGITADSAADYLAMRNVACIGGSWVVPATLLRNGDYAGIEEIAKDAAKLGV